jgi:hypothetical protein
MDPSTGTEAGTERAPLRPAPVPASGTRAVPVPAGVSPVTVPERAAGAIGRAGTGALEAARELWLHPDRFLHVILHGKAETMRQHRAHVKSRAWVPDGMDGGARKAVIAAGIAHHLIVARPLKASMKAVKFAAEKVDQAADRPLRLYLTAVLVLVLFFLLARYL